MNKIHFKRGDTEILIEGDTKFIEKHISIFKKDIGDFTSPGKKDKVLAPAIQKTTDKPSDPGVDLLSLYQEKKPSTHYDKIAVFGFYLTETGKNVFSIEDLRACYLELRKITKIPGKLEVTIADTIRYTGYIKRSGSKSLTLTSSGLNYVIHQLPATK